MPSILSKGTADGPSSEFTLTAADVVSLNLNPARAPFVDPAISCQVQCKTSDGTWVHVGVMNAENPVQVIQGPGTYRAYRRECVASYGVDKV